MIVEPLHPSSPWIDEIARIQFDHWGPLTGQPSRQAYETFLGEAAAAHGLPTTLVAHRDGVLLGSVNLMAAEMTIRPSLTPWMGQLYVREDARKSGIGGRLVVAAAAEAAALGFPYLYLFTSGTLPAYYRALGWEDVEDVAYLGRMRTIMRLALPRAS